MQPLPKYTKRQRHNYLVAKALISVGCPVFPCKSEDKRPLIPGWKFHDIRMSADQRETIRAEFVQNWGFKPVHIGATLYASTLRKFLHQFPDAVFGIPCGLAGIIVVDADEKDDGPRLLSKFVNENGGWPEGVVTVPTRSGGQHHYFTNDANLGCSAGKMKGLGCDVKGNGGLCIAPSSWRIDGKRYGDLDDLARFVNAYRAKQLVPVPDFVKAAIGEPKSGSVPNPNAGRQETETLNELRLLNMGDGGDDDVAEELGAEVIMSWFLRYLEETPMGEDRSASVYRYRFLQMLRAMLPELSAAEGLSVLCFVSGSGLDEVGDYAGDRHKGKDEVGVFTLANFARDWNRTKYSKFNPGLPCTGEAFGAVGEV